MDQTAHSDLSEPGGQGGVTPGPGESASVGDLIHIFWRRKTLMIGSMAFITGLAALIAFQIPPEYSATARLMIHPVKSDAAHTWTPTDRHADDLQKKVCAAVQHGEREGVGRRAIFQRVRDLACDACGLTASALPPVRADSRPVPAMSEPWYCCAEPTVEQLARV